MFVRLLSLPLDLGAAGFEVTITQGERGWSVEAKKDLTPNATLHLVGRARSYTSALFQLADSAADAIDRLQREARETVEIARESEIAA